MFIIWDVTNTTNIDETVYVQRWNRDDMFKFSRARAVYNIDGIGVVAF